MSAFFPDASTPASPVPAPRYLNIALAVSAVLFLVLAQRSFVYVPDDAFITFRYSRNLADGFGPIFNPGAPATDRTEGFSCPLFMVVMAILFKLPLGLDALLRAKFFGLLCGLAVLFLVPKLAARLRLPGWTQAALPILLAAHAGISVSAVDGMETVFQALLMTLAAFLFLAAFDAETNPAEGPNGKTIELSGLAFAVCALNRPEGLLALVSAAGLLMLAKGRSWGGRETRWLLCAAVPVVAWFLFRRAFYGLWLPNTYYAKIAPLDEAIFKGVTYLLRTFFYQMNENVLLFVVGAAWWVLALTGASGERFRRFPAILVPLLAGGQALFALRSGGDWMGGWRYMVAALPLLMLLSVTGIVEIANALRNAKAAAQAVSVNLCAALFAACLFGQSGYWTQGEHDGCVSWASKGFSLQQRVLLTGWKLERGLRISDWLNRNAPPGSVAAYSEMGVTPFFSPQIRFLDVDGLTDHGVATLPNAKHGQIGVESNYLSADTPVGAYLKNERKPDYLLCGATLESQPTALGDAYPFAAQFPIPIFAGENTSDSTQTKPALMGVWKRK